MLFFSETMTICTC